MSLARARRAAYREDPVDVRGLARAYRKPRTSRRFGQQIKIDTACARHARAVEAAHRVGAALEGVCRDFLMELPPEHRETIDDFIALAEAGPGALIGLAAERPRMQAERAIEAYEALAAAAAAVPRIRAMREYLRATGLMPGTAGYSAAETTAAPGEGSAADKAIAAAQVECQLVLVAMESAVPRWAARGFDALEIRFQKFKWGYIQLYQAAHERWRRESERFAIELGEARKHFGARSGPGWRRARMTRSRA